MSHPNKAKGTRWESALAGYLGVKRIGSVNGCNDQGDLNHPHFVIEAKDEARIDLAGYMVELEREVNNAGKRWGFAMIKKRRASVGDGYAVMPVWMARGLMDYLAHLETGGYPVGGISEFKATFMPYEDDLPFAVNPLTGLTK